MHPGTLIAGLALLLAGCQVDPADAAASRGLEPDSLVVDLFSLNAALRTRDNASLLTPLGRSRLRALDSGVAIGDEVIIGTARQVRTWSAYFLHERDLHCDGHYAGEEALLIVYDDGLEGKCHDTAFAWVPAYPYRKPVLISFVEGKGFWISAGQVDFASGKLVIHFDGFRGRDG